MHIYDMRGQLVRTLELGHKGAGQYLSPASAAYWDGRNESGEPVSSGVYIYQLKTPTFQQMKRMVILK
jgi:flagellar hook assembly protein FlgD